MKHIKSYKLFESIKLPDGVSAETIEEICYDITDDGKFQCGVHYNDKNGNYIIISLTNIHDYNGFKFSEVKEVILRLKRYLGDNFDKCGFVIVGEFERIFTKLTDDVDNYDDVFLSNIAIFIK